jgi:hypothetical protein
MWIRNPAYRDQEEEEEEEGGPSASDESRLLSLSSELALTDGLALALGEYTETLLQTSVASKIKVFKHKKMVSRHSEI